MNIVIVAGLLIGVLLVGYLAWRFPKTVGAGLWRFFTTLAWAATTLSAALKRSLDASLQWSPHANPIARLVFLFLSLCVFAGDYSIATLRSAALLGITAHTLSWLPLDAFQGLLWLCCPALWGIGTLDLLGIMPEGWRLFSGVQRYHRVVRASLVIVSLLFTLLSIVNSAGFVFYGQLLLMPDQSAIDPNVLAAYILLGFGFTLAGVSVIALWALIVGLAGVVTICVGTLYCVCGLLSLLCTLLGNTLAARRQGLFLSSHDEIELAHLPGFSDGAFSLSSDVPLPLSEEEVSLMTGTRTDRHLTLVMTGPRSNAVGLEILQQFSDMGASGMLLAYALTDLSRPATQQLRVNIPGAKNLSRLPQEMTNAGTNETREPAYTALSRSIHNTIVDAYTTKHGGVIILAVDPDLLEQVEDPLAMLHRRLPQQTILLLVPVSPRTPIDRYVEQLRDLQQKKVVATSIVVDTQASPYAYATDPDSEVHAWAHLMAELCIASYHDEQNSSVAVVARRMGEQSPLAGLSLSINPVANGKTPLLWRAVRAVASNAGDRGSGDMADLLVQTRECLKQAHLPEASLTSAEAIAADAATFTLVTLPVSPAEKRGKEAVNTLRGDLGRTYPNSEGIFVRGNVRFPSMPKGYYCSTACLYPLPLPVAASSPADEEADIAGASGFEELPVESGNATEVVVKANGRKQR